MLLVGRGERSDLTASLEKFGVNVSPHSVNHDERGREGKRLEEQFRLNSAHLGLQTCIERSAAIGIGDSDLCEFPRELVGRDRVFEPCELRSHRLNRQCVLQAIATREPNARDGDIGTKIDEKCVKRSFGDSVILSDGNRSIVLKITLVMS